MTDRPTTDHPDRPTDQPAVDHDLDQAVRRAGWWRTGFYVVVLLVALGGQVSGAVEALGMPLLVALPAVGALELGGIVVLNNADVRRRLGERAVGSRILSAVIAVGAVAFNWVAHANHLLGAFFAGMSALGYLVWLMHTENQRRDRLRAKGQLPPTAPAYPAGQWLRHPWLTRRARHLALVSPDLGLYGSLAAAATAVRDERRRAAITKILRRQIRAAADPAAAEMAVTVFDLDEIARRVADRADYDRLTNLVATGLDPDRLLRPADQTPTASAPTQSTGVVDQPPTGTDQEPTDRPRKTTTKTTGHRPAEPTNGRPALRLVGHSAAAVTNAAYLRSIYGDRLPTVDRDVRDRTGWSHGRAVAAIAAYRDGADLSTPDGSRDDEQDDRDDQERVPALTGTG